MRLGHYSFQSPVEFMENWNHYLIIENPRQLSGYIIEMNNQLEGEEGDFILMHEDDVMDIQKHVEMIINPFSIDPNSKKNVSSLHDLINKMAYDDMCYIRTEEIVSELSSYIEELSIQQSVYSIPMKEIDFKGLLKMADVRFNADPETILERICCFIDITNEFSGVELFIFVNLRSFLTDEEIESFHEFVNYRKVHVLHIENKIFDFGRDDSVKIIDKDLCEIPVNDCKG